MTRMTDDTREVVAQMRVAKAAARLCIQGLARLERDYPSAVATRMTLQARPYVETSLESLEDAIDAAGGVFTKGVTA